MAADVLFLEYPKCSTCQKAKKWLDAHDVAYTDRHIVEDNPTAEELRAWHERSGLPLKLSLIHISLRQAHQGTPGKPRIAQKVIARRTKPQVRRAGRPSHLRLPSRRSRP